MKRSETQLLSMDTAATQMKQYEKSFSVATWYTGTPYAITVFDAQKKSRQNRGEDHPK